MCWPFYDFLKLYLVGFVQRTFSMPSEIDVYFIERARRIFCLGRQDKERDITWYKTLDLHELFWRNIKDTKQIKQLADQGFSLAQSYLAITSDIDLPYKPKTNCSTLQTIAATIQRTVPKHFQSPEDQRYIESFNQNTLRFSYDLLLSTGNMQFILFWQFNTSFLIGLPMET